LAKVSLVPAPGTSSRKWTGMTKGRRRNLKERVSRALPWTILEAAFSSMLLIAQVVILARLLGPGEFGRAVLTQSIVSLIQIVSAWGLSEALVRHRSVHTAVLDTAFWASLVLGLCGFAVCLALMPVVVQVFPDGIDPDFLAVQGLSCVSAALLTVPNAVLTRKLRTWTMAAGALWQRLVTFMVSIVLAWHGLGAWSMVIGAVAGSFAGVAFFWSMHPRRPRLRVSRSDLRPMMRFGAVYWTEMLLQASARQSAMLLIGFYHGPIGLGLFTFGLRIVEQVALLMLTIVSRFGMPVLSEIHRSGGDMIPAFVSGSRILAAAAFPVLVGIACVAPDVVPAFFGEQWLSAVPIIQALALFWSISLTRSVVPAYLRVVGRQSANMILSVIYLAIATASLVLTSHLTVAAAVAVAYGSRIVIGAPFSMVLFSWAGGVPIREQVRPLLGPLVAVLMMVAAVAGIRAAIAEETAFLRLAGSVLAGAVAYVAAIAVFDRPTTLLLRSLVAKMARRGGGHRA
jgi:teichuronic acid exporter